MTIGVATMAENGMIVLASDRMLTRGVSQSEPETPKIYHFTDGHPITVSWAGDAAVFAEVIQVYLDRAKHLRQPASVNDAVNLYCACFAEYVSDRAEREYLTRLGLSKADLVSSRVSDRRADRLMDLMFGYSLGDSESVATIFAGHDHGGAHIWRTSNSDSMCCDLEGFAAIGTGAENAIAHLTFGGYHRGCSMYDAIIAAFFSKRRAESAQGVGKEIDICVRPAGDKKPIKIPNPSDFLKALDAAYTGYCGSERQALGQAIRSASAAIRHEIEKDAAPPEAKPDGQQDTLAPQSLEASTPDQPPQPPSQG